MCFWWSKEGLGEEMDSSHTAVFCKPVWEKNNNCFTDTQGMWEWVGKSFMQLCNDTVVYVIVTGDVCSNDKAALKIMCTLLQNKTQNSLLYIYEECAYLQIYMWHTPIIQFVGNYSN